MNPTEGTSAPTSAAPTAGSPPVVWERAAMSMHAANLWALPILGLAYAAVAVAYGTVWQPENGSALTRPWTAPLWVWLALLPGIVAHEALHAVGWIACGIPVHSVRFGVYWMLLTPFVHCQAVVHARPYRVGGAAPGVVLGLLPALLGVALGNDGLALFGALFLGAAAGDGLLLWLLRPAAARAAVRDLPDRMGCLYTTRAVVDLAAVADPLLPGPEGPPPAATGQGLRPRLRGVLDVSSLVGVLLGAVSLRLGVGSHLPSFTHGPSLLIVTAVTLGAVFLSFPLSDVVRIPLFLQHLIVTPAPVFLRLQGDRYGTSLRQRRREAPLRQRLRAAWTAARDAQVTEELRLGVAMCRRARTYAIAAGGTGTLVGAVILLSQAEDPTQLGRGAAVTLIALLYGVVAAFLVFLPMQTKLERLLAAMALPLPAPDAAEVVLADVAAPRQLTARQVLRRTATRVAWQVPLFFLPFAGLALLMAPSGPAWRLLAAVAAEALPWAVLAAGLVLRAGLLAFLEVRGTAPSARLLVRLHTLAAVLALAGLAVWVHVPLPATGGPSVTALPAVGLQIDGDLGDWPARAQWHAIDQVTGAYGSTDLDGADLSTSADLSPRFRVAWDPQGQRLYVAVEARDDRLVTGADDPHHTDACEVYLGGRGDRRANGLRALLFGWAGGLPAQQYVSLPGPGNYGPGHRTDGLSLLGGDLRRTTTQVAWRRAGDVTTYEWALQAFDAYPDRPLRLAASVTIGFDVVVVDFDGDGDPAWVCWGPPIGFKFVDTGKLGRLQLAADETPP